MKSVTINCTLLKPSGIKLSIDTVIGRLPVGVNVIGDAPVLLLTDNAFTGESPLDAAPELLVLVVTTAGMVSNGGDGAAANNGVPDVFVCSPLPLATFCNKFSKVGHPLKNV